MAIESVKGIPEGKMAYLSSRTVNDKVDIVHTIRDSDHPDLVAVMLKKEKDKQKAAEQAEPEEAVEGDTPNPYTLAAIIGGSSIIIIALILLMVVLARRR